jgi:hypothetical protein
MGLPPVAYFPYIDLDATLLRGVLLYFEQVHLFHPSFFSPSGPDKKSRAKGWIITHVPFVPPIDDRECERLLRDYELFAARHLDSGYLDYIKHGGVEGLLELPGYELIREIKSYDLDMEDGGQRPQEMLRGQILLTLAQQWDRQRREIQEGLRELEKMEHSLHHSLGMEREEEEFWAGDADDLPGPEVDDFLIPQRLSAWMELYTSSKLHNTLCLLTDNSVAWRCALEHDIKHEDPGEDFFRINLPRLFPGSMEDVERAREALEGLVSWDVFCERMGSFIKECRELREPAGPTPDGVPGEMMTRARALSCYFNEGVLEEVIQCLLNVGLGGDEEGWAQWTLKGYPSLDQGMVLLWGRED